jgi:hypothetical protein
MQKALPAAPRKKLLWIGMAILAVHLLALQLTFGPPVSLRTPLDNALTARLIVPQTPLAAPAPPAPAPRPRRAPRANAVQPAPAHPAATTAPAADEAPPADVPPSPVAAAAKPALAGREATPAPAAAPARPEAALNIPAPVLLRYEIRAKVSILPLLSAEGSLLWRHDGSSYDSRLELSSGLLGSRVQTSRGQITAQGLAPRRFSDKIRSEVAAHFERDKGKIIFSANTPDEQLLPGAQDQLSIFVQLAALLATHPERYPPGTFIETQSVGARFAEIWRIRVEGPELLQLPGGEQATLKLVHTPADENAVKVELWLARSVGMLPVRIRLSQSNGDYIDQQWRGSETP